MGRLIDEDILIDSIPDLSVFEQEDFGTPDMIRLIEDAPTVQAISKADYEKRLKADMVDILEDIKLKIKEYCDDQYAENEYPAGYAVIDIIQKKIDALKVESEDI